MSIFSRFFKNKEVDEIKKEIPAQTQNPRNNPDKPEIVINRDAPEPSDNPNLDEQQETKGKAPDTKKDGNTELSGAGRKQTKLKRRKYKDRNGKINKKKVEELCLQGMSNADIAIHQGVNHSTIWRFVQSLDKEKQELKKYDEMKADALTKNHGLSVERTEYMLSSMSDQSIDAMSESEKKEWFKAMKIGQGIDNQNIRLEKGKSTVNNMVVSVFQQKAHEQPPN